MYDLVLFVVAPLLCSLALVARRLSLLKMLGFFQGHLCFCFVFGNGIFAYWCRHMSFAYLSTNTYSFLFYFSPIFILVSLASCFPALAPHQRSHKLPVSHFEKDYWKMWGKGLWKSLLHLAKIISPLKRQSDVLWWRQSLHVCKTVENRPGLPVDWKAIIKVN